MSIPRQRRARAATRVGNGPVVVIGGGHQGLVCAVLLAEAGVDVTVVEAQDELGGAVRSGPLTGVGLEHDRYATNMNLFLGSPFYQAHADALKRAGLAFVTSGEPYASAFPDGRSLRVVSDAEATLAMWREHDERDAAGWQRLETVFDDVAAAYLPLSSHALPSLAGARALWAVGRSARTTSLSELVQVVASSTRALGERYLFTPEARALAAAWGMHLDFAPDVAGGAVFPLLELFLDMRLGMSVVAGGASRLPAALRTLLEAHAGRVLTGVPAEQIVLDEGAVQSVRLTDGTTLPARGGVVCTTTLPALVRTLLSGQSIPSALSSAAERFRFGPGTFMLHLETSGPLPWSDPRLAASAYVHVGPYVDDMARTYQQSLAGVLPDEPLLVVGQTSRVDPSRSTDPARHAVWVQVRTVPGTILGDAGAADGRDLSGASWDAAGGVFADRVLAKLDRYAPGASGRVVDRAVSTPADLHATNANLVGGDSVSGSHHLDQFAGLRPSLRLSRYRTPLTGLYLAGAGTWPGAGVNGVSGQLAAEALLSDRQPFRSWHRLVSRRDRTRLADAQPL